MFRRPLSTFLVILFFGVGSPRPISAAAFEDIGSGQILFRKESGRHLAALHLKSHAELKITGIIAHVTLTQTFRNQTQDWREAVYVMPMADTAAVSGMKMIIGERVIRAKIKEKEVARKIYNKAKSEGKKAALTEQSRPNLFRQNVANIGPGEVVEIEITYIQTVDYDYGEFSLRLPMTLTPRFMPGRPLTDGVPLVTDAHGWAMPTTEVADAHLISPPMTERLGQEIVNPISISISLETGLDLKEIASPYHPVSVTRRDEIYRVELSQGEVSMDRDFVLRWQPVVEGVPRAAVFRERVAGEDYVLLMMVPPDRDHSIRALPRDMIFVIDTSGSMQGTSIEQAKSSLKRAISSLRPEDRFNLIEFNNAWSRLYSGVQPADSSNLRQAEDWAARLQAGGGTNMLPALNVAMQLGEEERNLKHIVFITDGAVGNETALFEAIAGKLGDGRLFPVGIGSAPNSYFMRQAAKFGRGTYTHIGDLKDVTVKMDELYEKIDHPVATDVVVQWPGEVESYPKKIPALYRGEPLLIFAKADQLDGEIHISGVTADSGWNQSLSLEAKSSQSGIGSLWARKKIETLNDAEVRGEDKETIRKAIVNVALRHSLVSRYTSLVAVEEFVERMPHEKLRSSAVPNALAKGQVLTAMYPRTATRSSLSLLVGLTVMLTALLWIVVWRRMERLHA
ncbi:MAG: marine proteobacterial sortase target protein [Gammaproteobacteria bacterium]|nr:marine proteobacterial sortase target protein [Gammaproteobacteria bacterium]